MPYDKTLDARIRKIVSGWGETEAKKMFGGVCHLMHGNMYCGVHKEFLILRLGQKPAEEALESPVARPLDITGKPMKGWVMVEPEGFESGEDLAAWLEKARAFAQTLPPK